MAVQLKDGDIQVQQELSTRQSIEYLNAKYPDLHLTIDAFRHRVTRGVGIPHKTRKEEGVIGWYFLKEDLDAIRFRSLWRKRYPNIVPVAIHSSAQFNELQHKYGALVDDAGMLAELEKRFHYRFTLGMLKQRRHRKTIITVGWTGGKRKQHWYPVKQINDLFFQPDHASTVEPLPFPVQEKTSVAGE